MFKGNLQETSHLEKVAPIYNTHLVCNQLSKDKPSQDPLIGYWTLYVRLLVSGEHLPLRAHFVVAAFVLAILETPGWSACCALFDTFSS